MRAKALELDMVASRYGVLPSQCAQLDYDDYMLNAVVAGAALREEAAQAKRMEDKSRGSLRRR